MPLNGDESNLDDGVVVHALTRRQFERLANSLAKSHPGAAGSLREGIEETLKLIAFGIEGALYKTLRTTNPIESLNGLIGQLSVA